MEYLVLTLFALDLILCVLLHISTVIALLVGLLIFVFYAHRKGFSLHAIGSMSLSGILTVRNILITFLFIGSLTALWRSSGCIPTIVSLAAGLIHPGYFILLTFLLCSLTSFLTGTSFGTAATVGVICMSIASSLNISSVWMGGAILSGAFFGDRCSPVSTSALLVSTITRTDLYRNIRNMLRTAVIPTILTSLIYLIAGMRTPVRDTALNISSLFQNAFVLHPLCLLPAAAILLLALFKVSVKTAMLVSIIIAAVITLTLQQMTLPELIQTIIYGYTARDTSLAPLVNGGGVVSMIRVAAIVCIASCYAGIFRETGLLAPVQKHLRVFQERFGIFPAVLLVSLPASMIACNQTLSIMLTHQLTAGSDTDDEKLALYLENSVVLISALVPWSIAGSVPLATVGAPLSAMAAAVFLYILPLYTLIFTGIRPFPFSSQA